ncbi:MAG: hypothetical protein HYR83_13665 [Planctomycetes bacterium]|nr:hypothetical protein [Planctomycetota bacterium]
MAFDEHRGVTVMFGGANISGRLADTWEWDGSIWRRVEDGTSGPSRRVGAAMAYDLDHQRSVVFGGSGTNPPWYSDTWVWDGQYWDILNTSGPTARTGAYLAYMCASHYMLMAGGSGFAPFSDLQWQLRDIADFPSDGPRAERYPSCESFYSYAKKNRVISFSPPLVPLGASGIGLRVTFESLPNGSICATPNFSSFNGARMWVGEEVLQSGQQSGVFKLQTDPLFRDWTTVPGGVIHVSDCNIVPCATYTIQSISDVDYPLGTYSTPLLLSTAPAWGDVVASNDPVPPNGVVNISDVAAIVDCFKDIPGAPPKSWCDLVPDNVTHQMNLVVNISDVAAGVDAFRGRTYSLSGPTAPSACP